MDLVAAAALNNAAWCDHVCRDAGIATEWTDSAWFANGPAPPFYPNVVTLSPAAVDAQIALAAAVAEGSAVKDSFAALDLAPLGFGVLFDATWLSRGGRPSPSDDREFDNVEADGATADATCAAGVVGLTNVVFTGDQSTFVQGKSFVALCKCCEDRWPGWPLVLYERGGQVEWLAQYGFQPIGPLRVWQRRM